MDAQSPGRNLMRFAPPEKIRPDNNSRSQSASSRKTMISSRRKSKFPLIIPISCDLQRQLQRILPTFTDRSRYHTPSFYILITSGGSLPKKRAPCMKRSSRTFSGSRPKNHRGYLNHASTTLTAAYRRPANSRNHPACPRPRICAPISARLNPTRIVRVYGSPKTDPPLLTSDHAWDCGYPECESIYFIRKSLPKAALRRAATPGLIQPAIINDSPSTTFGTVRNSKRSGKRCKKGPHAPYAPLWRVSGDLRKHLIERMSYFSDFTEAN